MGTIHLFARSAAAAALASAFGAGVAAEPADESLKPYLVEIAPGPQSAHEMLGLSHTAVTSLQSAKDWLGVIGATDQNDAKSGFGLAFTPGRSDIQALAVSVRKYADPKLWVHRLWGATTLSYAQNKAEYGGVDYRQSAFFAQTTYYLKAEEDPLVAAFNGVAGCVSGKKLAEEFNDELLRRLAAAKKANPGMTPEQSEAMFAKLEEALAKEAEEAQAGPMSFMSRASQATRACAQKAMNEAAAKWNSSRIGLTIGQGWVTGSAAGSPRLSLGQHFSLSAALALPGMESSLLNVTVRHTRREVDLSTLAGTPAYKQGTQAAARFTYDAGGTTKNAYVLAEISTVKSDTLTQSSTAFRQALGVDYKVGNGMWIELRYGRVRDADGSGTQNKTLMNFKFSPEAGIPKLLGG